MLYSPEFVLHLDLPELSTSLPQSLQDLGIVATGPVHSAAESLTLRSRCQEDYRKATLFVDSIKMYYKGTFISSESESSSLGSGVVHLYKGSGSANPVEGTVEHPDLFKGSDVLAILAVPSYMTSADLLGFFGDSLQNISHVRILRTEDLRRLLVLLKFRSTVASHEFREKFNGAVFNSMEPETVHCVPVTSITFCGRVRSAEDFPMLTGQAEDGSRVVNRKSLKALPPIMTLTELPTCVVCLERMDASATGLLTIACEHTFHCACLSKWVDTQATCPICRFSVARDVLNESDKHCHALQCSSEKNLWMCLICGTINCGRYESQHA